MSTPKEGKKWLIWSIKHGAWWGPNRSRYFTLRECAGRYPFAEACEIVKTSNQHLQNQPSSAMVEDPCYDTD